MTQSIRFSTIEQLSQLVKEKKITHTHIIEQTKNLFAQHDQYNCAIEIFDTPLHNDIPNSALNGIPGLIKDVICIKDRKMSCSSKILQNFTSPYDATVIHNLHNHGAISIGRANCDQFGMGSSNENSFYGPCKNPWDIKKVSGGSSGGSAVAVAAGLVPFALGAETGGSVRQPASLCNIVGLKPTYGLLSRYGLVAYASSIDQIGIFTHTAADCAIVLSACAGKDTKDGTSTAPFEKHNYYNALKNASLKGKKIAIIKNAFESKGMNPHVTSLLKEALVVFESQGALIDYVTLPTMEYSAAVYIIISRAEAASNLARFDGVKYGYRSDNYTSLESMYCNTRHDGFSDVVKKRIIVGNYVLSAGFADQYYAKAKIKQKEMTDEFTTTLEQYDALFSPVTAEPAFSIGQIDSNSIVLDLQDYFTCPANLTGIPAVSVPCGFVNNLPIGFQLFGKNLMNKLF